MKPPTHIDFPTRPMANGDAANPDVPAIGSKRLFQTTTGFLIKESDGTVRPPTIDDLCELLIGAIAAMRAMKL